MRIAVIGGGAAGLMATATLSELEEDLEIHLFEKTKNLGTKVSISGGGRCNLSTGIRDRKNLLSKYPRGADFIKQALGKFSPKATYEWFEEKGLPLKIESDLRVFPKSDQGQDVVNLLISQFKNVKIHLQEGAVKLEANDEGFTLTTSKSQYNFDKVIITTGGQAYSHTGSSGDGYSLAKALGHTTSDLAPSLNSFETQETWPKDISGLVLPKAKIEQQEGSLLFTHFGISGPLTFAYSAQIAYEKLPHQIQLIPNLDLNQSTFDQELQKQLADNPSKQIINILTQYIPKKLIQVIAPNYAQKASELSKESRKEIVKLLTQGIPLTLIKRRPGDEFVTAGGITSSEINPKTMESKICPGLYFAGEILNYDGVTGGFNLQAAWSTGRLVGKSISTSN